MTHDGAAFGIDPYIRHSPVTLETLAVVGDLQARHLGARRVQFAVAILTRHETTRYIGFKCRCLDAMALVTGQACILSVLMMANSAIAGYGGMFFVIEEYGLIDFHQTVQFDETAPSGCA